MPNPKKLSHKIPPPQTQPGTSSQLASTHEESGILPGKNVLFSIDRTFSASSEFYEDSDDQVTLQLKQYKTKEARRREFFQQFEGAEKETNVACGPSGFGDVEGNVIGQVDEFPFGQGDDDDEEEEEDEEEDEEDNIDDDENFGENEKQQHVRNKGDASSDDHHHHHFHPTNSHTNNDSSSNNEDINNDADVGIANGKSAGGGRVHRKKSILRHVHDTKASGVSINSFNGSAASSSIISDGKMGSSMNGSFNSQFYNNFYSRAARRNDFQRYTRGPYAPLDRCNSTSASSAHSSTLTTHYYPEGGWGYVVLATALFSHSLLCGFLLCGGIFATKALDRFGHELRVESVWLISLSLGVSLLLSPLWVSICKRKSTRLTAVFGGLVVSLGCLFTSFASQFHQLYISYVIFMGVGVGLTRDASCLMVGQYFKRRRDFVESVLVSASGMGIILMTIFMEFALGSIGWRLGLQAITGTLTLTFLLGSCYRSASLYHPQRRAIVHLKNQKRKIKEKEKKNDGPPFLDVESLTSRSMQILLVSCAFTAWGHSPLFHLALECQDEGMEETETLLLYVYIGSGWVIGAWVFGFLAIQKNEECRISKLYLCQVTALLCGVSIIALTNVKEPSGLVTFSWIYGFAMGGYQYMLKILIYEKFRARMFPMAWSFIQSVQGASLILGIPVIGYINTSAGRRKGYFVSAAAIFLGFFIMCISAVGSRQLRRHKSSRSSMKTCETTDSLQSPGLRRISFTFPDEQMSPPRISKEERSSSGSERSMRISRLGSHSHGEQMPKELTRISEEGILDTTNH